jgi:hypothetical protein
MMVTFHDGGVMPGYNDGQEEEVKEESKGEGKRHTILKSSNIFLYRIR